MTINSTTRCPFSGAPATVEEPAEQRTQAPVVDVDPFDEATLASPYAMHERLREADADVVYIPKYDIHAVARYDAVRDTLEKDRKSTRLNSSHVAISYAVCCLQH